MTEDIDHTHGDTGTKPPDTLNFQQGGLPDPEHFDWFWTEVPSAINDHADELDKFDEKAQDAVAAALTGGGDVTVTYDDNDDTITVDASTLTDEQVEDTVSSLVSSDSNLSWSYNDNGDTLTISLADSISVGTLETDSITDGAGVTHTGELADKSDISTPASIVQTTYQSYTDLPTPSDGLTDRELVYVSGREDYVIPRDLSPKWVSIFDQTVVAGVKLVEDFEDGSINVSYASSQWSNPDEISSVSGLAGDSAIQTDTVTNSFIEVDYKPASVEFLWKGQLLATDNASAGTTDFEIMNGNGDILAKIDVEIDNTPEGSDSTYQPRINGNNTLSEGTTYNIEFKFYWDAGTFDFIVDGETEFSELPINSSWEPPLRLGFVIDANGENESRMTIDDLTIYPLI